MVVIDQLNRKLDLPATPKRIISLVPSQTELLYHLGLNDEVVGITKFCVHPNEWFVSKAKIGGTKNYQFDKIKSLNPDLIIGNKEENEKEGIEELMKLYPVWMSDIYNLKDAFDMITRIGVVVGKQQESIELKLLIEAQFNRFSAFRANLDIHHNSALKIEPSNVELPKVAYFIWKKPYMVAGQNTFINEMLRICGYNNVFATIQTSRYPQVSEQELVEANPQLIFLSSEPFPFKDKHIQEFKMMCPHAKVIVVDGEMFSWYGSRLLKAPDYFTRLIQLLCE